MDQLAPPLPARDDPRRNAPPAPDATPATPGRGHPTRVPVALLRSRLGETLGRVRFAGERLVLTTHGTPIAAVVPLDDLERLEQVDVVGIPTPVVEKSVVLPVSGAEL